MKVRLHSILPTKTVPITKAVKYEFTTAPIQLGPGYEEMCKVGNLRLGKLISNVDELLKSESKNLNDGNLIQKAKKKLQYNAYLNYLDKLKKQHASGKNAYYYQNLDDEGKFVDHFKSLVVMMNLKTNDAINKATLPTLDTMEQIKKSVKPWDGVNHLVKSILKQNK